MPTAENLLELAAWYRAFAERAGNPTIWAAPLRTAEDLEAEAERLDAAARARQQADALPRHRY